MVGNDGVFDRPGVRDLGPALGFERAPFRLTKLEVIQRVMEPDVIGVRRIHGATLCVPKLKSPSVSRHCS
jgi:hypothetical protein